MGEGGTAFVLVSGHMDSDKMEPEAPPLAASSAAHYSIGCWRPLAWDRGPGPPAHNQGCLHPYVQITIAEDHVWNRYAEGRWGCVPEIIM